jgi:predicted acetyltransferase
MLSRFFRKFGYERAVSILSIIAAVGAIVFAALAMFFLNLFEKMVSGLG